MLHLVTTLKEDFEKLGIVTINIDGKTWYSTSDIQRLIGYKSNIHGHRFIEEKDRVLLHTRDYPELKEYYDRCIWKMTFTTESGVLALIFRSQMPGAFKLQDYIYEKILLLSLNGAFLFLQFRK